MTTTITVRDGQIIGYLSATEYARKYKIPEATVRVWIKRGKLESLKIGINNYIKEDLIPPAYEKPGRKRKETANG